MVVVLLLVFFLLTMVIISVALMYAVEVNADLHDFATSIGAVKLKEDFSSSLTSVSGVWNQKKVGFGLSEIWRGSGNRSYVAFSKIALDLQVSLGPCGLEVRDP